MQLVDINPTLIYLLTPHQLKLLLYMKSFFGIKNRKSYYVKFSVTEYAKTLRMSNTTIMKARDALEKLGIIKCMSEARRFRQRDGSYKYQPSLWKVCDYKFANTLTQQIITKTKKSGSSYIHETCRVAKQFNGTTSTSNFF